MRKAGDVKCVSRRFTELREYVTTVDPRGQEIPIIKGVMI
jgi:hypothetical protein